MRGLSCVVAALAGLALAGCANRTINFDTLPDGTAIPYWDGTSSLVPGNPAVINTQYASRGVASIASGGGGVVALGGQQTSSPPNVACPFGAGGLINYGQTTRIELAEPSDRVWVNIVPISLVTSVSAYNSSGTLLATEASNGPNVEFINGSRRVRVAGIDITRIEIAGSRYCFDDFTWQDSLF